jgi:hypothetical protein
MWWRLFVIACVLGAASFISAQESTYSGRYVFKDYRAGRGGYVNYLDVTHSDNGRLQVSFELTYFYMAGKAETFKEGSGQGEDLLDGNKLTATLSDGAGGTCRVAMTFSGVSVTVRSTNCGINVVPDGVYVKERAGKRTGGIAAPRPSVPRTVLQPEVCPNPQAPCNTAAKKFAPFELSFQLPGKLTRGKTYESLPFHAVILKTYQEEACDAEGHTRSIEQERLRIQLRYPRNKVFASYSCPNLDAVDYTFQGKLDSTGERVLVMTFIAVYAGKTEAQAKQFLSYVKTTYPEAQLKEMKASYELLDQ